MRLLKSVFLSALLFFILGGVAGADTLGESHLFFISTQYDAQGRAAVNATLRQVSDHAYFYIEDNYWNTLNSTTRSESINQIRVVADEFDNRIYPIEREFFGSEPNPGIDGDSRITILLTPLVEIAGGYYHTNNQFPRTRVPESNEREMIYINVSSINNTKKVFPFLAHEFQHLISFHEKNQLRNIDDDVWLNELRSEYAVTLLGYNSDLAGSHLERRKAAFLENPSDSLTEWKNQPADYGQIMFFGEYIAEHWGSEVISQTIKSNSGGVMSLNEALAEEGFSDSFLDVFVRWIVASFLNDASVDSKFGYTNENLQDLRPSASRIFGNPAEGQIFLISDDIKDWEARWYGIGPFASGDLPAQASSTVLKIDFSSPSLTSFIIPYLVFKNDGSATWSVFNPDFKSNTLYIERIGGEVSRIAILPVKKDKISGFGSNEPPVSLTISIERIASTSSGIVMPPPISSSTVIPASKTLNPEPSTLNPNFPDGSLVRADGDYKVYVINGGWRRHIVSPEIFNFYPHLGFDKVRVVSPEVVAGYKESNMVRYADDESVYEIDSNGVRRWLNMSGDQFINSGRSFDAVFLVNELELNFYKTGVSITQ